MCYVVTFFILAMLSWLINPCVCGVKGRCREIMSEACSSACWGKDREKSKKEVNDLLDKGQSLRYILAASPATPPPKAYI